MKTTKSTIPCSTCTNGQNLFESETAFGGVEWQVDETLDKLTIAGITKEAIVVGMDNTGASRIREYTPSKDENYGGGEGEQYLDFIETEVMPFNQRPISNPKRTRQYLCNGLFSRRINQFLRRLDAQSHLWQSRLLIQ